MLITRINGKARSIALKRLNPNPVIEVDPSGKITFFNQADEKVLDNLGSCRGPYLCLYQLTLGEPFARYGRLP
ncbi:MAG: hypothetical protein A4E65_00763 [Syntrophorhabdus sp. PtaU1.Bin153]|nr:MAG: hypothetical protein A4E65_00763 [Syntrophorhabdus sp. PtaU1.Bin153]